MASASQALLSASNGNLAFFTNRLFFNPTFKELPTRKHTNFNLLCVRASSAESDDCNTEECAPDKEVGKVSMEWLAGDKTKVVGTFPPRSRGWTGYVEKDTAGQTNIYSVEPAVYVAESAIGSANAAAISAGLALISVAAASSILLQVGKNPPQMQTVEYSGPSLSYYISKFKPPEIIQASVGPEPEVSTASQAEASPPEVTQVQVEVGNQLEDVSSSTMS